MGKRDHEQHKQHEQPVVRQQGAQRRAEILEKSEAACRALTQQAEANMAQAVQRIVERVVEG